MESAARWRLGVIVAVLLATAPARGAPIDVNATIDRARRYILSSIDPADGRFCYNAELSRRDSTRRVCKNHDYNLLRHGGTIYALATLADKRGAQLVPTRAVEPAVRYLLSEKQMRAPVGHESVLAMWERKREYTIAKLGGAGLALVALTSELARRAVPSLGTDPRPQRLGDFVLLLQRADGSFQTHYYEGLWRRDRARRLRRDAAGGGLGSMLGGLFGRAADAPSEPSAPTTPPSREPTVMVGHSARTVGLHGKTATEPTSLYYPGEAVLGLIRLHGRTGAVRFLRGAARALAYLARARADTRTPSLPADHWALIATSELLSLDERTQRQAFGGLPPSARGAVLTHAERLVRAIVSSLDKHNVRSRPAPVATRLEGLLAIRPHVRTLSVRAQLERAVLSHARALCAGQVADGGPLDGGWRAKLPAEVLGLADTPAPPALPQRSPTPSKSAADGSVRIDFVQHALSALLGFEALLRERRAADGAAGVESTALAELARR